MDMAAPCIVGFEEACQSDAPKEVHVPQVQASAVEGQPVIDTQKAASVQQMWVPCAFVPVLCPMYENCDMNASASASWPQQNAGYNLNAPRHTQFKWNGTPKAPKARGSRWPVARMHAPWPGTWPAQPQISSSASSSAQAQSEGSKYSAASVILAIDNLPKNLCSKECFLAVLEASNIYKLVQAFVMVASKSQAVVAVAGEHEAQAVIRHFSSHQWVLGKNTVNVKYCASARSYIEEDLEQKSKAQEVFEKAKAERQASGHQRSLSSTSTTPSTVHEETSFPSMCSWGSSDGRRWADYADDEEEDEYCSTDAGTCRDHNLTSDGDFPSPMHKAFEEPEQDMSPIQQQL